MPHRELTFYKGLSIGPLLLRVIWFLRQVSLGQRRALALNKKALKLKPKPQTQMGSCLNKGPFCFPFVTRVLYYVGGPKSEPHLGVPSV